MSIKIEINLDLERFPNVLELLRELILAHFKD